MRCVRSVLISAVLFLLAGYAFADCEWQQKLVKDNQWAASSEIGSWPFFREGDEKLWLTAPKQTKKVQMALPDTGQVDYRDYDITVRLYPNRHFLEGDVQIIFRSKVAQLDRVDFVLYNDTLHIKSVTHGSDTLSYTYDDSLGVLRVWLRDTLMVGQQDTVRIAYSGYITPALSQKHLCQLDSTLGYSINPCVWYPAPYDLEYSSRFDLGATGRVRMTVPRTWRVVSNGGLQDSTATDSTQTFTWGTANAIYDFNFACGPYLMSIQPYSGILVRYYSFDTTDARNFLTYTTSVLNFYSRAFYPYSFEQLAFVDNQRFGGSRYTLTFQPLALYWIMIHEISHQWWGILVKTRTLDEAWLHEGFASYSEVLFREDSLGLGSRKGHLDTLAFEYLDWVPPDSDIPIIPTPWTSTYCPNVVYAKGGWVLHMLRGVVGDSTFFNVLRTYATNYKDSSTTVAMYRNVAEQVSGRNLGWFFDEWLYHTGVPRYTYAWQSRQIGVDTFQLTLRVNQLDSLFTMPIQTSIFTPGGRQDQWPVVAHRSDSFQFILTQAPDSVILDKDDWLLDRGITRLGVAAGPPSVTFTTTLLPVHPNPFRGSARFEYSLAAKGRVRLSVYNVAGQLVRELVNEPQAPGRYSASWDRRNESGRSVPAGVYFIRFETSAYRVTEKAVLLR